MREARALHRAMQEYRHHLPSAGGQGMTGLCRVEPYAVHDDVLSGDFGVDGPLAREIVAGVLTGPSIRAGSRVSPDAIHADTSWLDAFLTDPPPQLDAYLRQRDHSPGQKTDGLLKKAALQAGDSTWGAGNVAGNLHSANEAWSAHREAGGTAERLREAASRIRADHRATPSVRINRYMTLYNANRNPRGQPRLRLRIANMPLKVVTPALGDGVRTVKSVAGYSGVFHAKDLAQAQKLGRLASTAPVSANPWSVFKPRLAAGGFLTFAPSAMVDAYNSFDRDAGGTPRFNPRRFRELSLQSQSANLAGLLASTGATLAVAFVGLTGWPVIVIALGAGIVAQAVWGAWYDDNKEKMETLVLGPKS